MRLALAVATGLGPLALLPSLYDVANLPQTVLLQTSAAGLLAAALALAVWRRRGRKLEWPPLAGPLAAWLAWSGLACAWSPNPALSIRLWLYWVAASVVYVLLFHLSDRGQDVRPVLAAALAAGAAVAVLGIGQRALGWTFVPQAFPPAATFANKNIAAQFAVGVLPFALAWRAGPRRGRGAALAGAAAALLLLFVALTRTRSAAAAVAVEAVVVFAWWDARRRWLWALAAVAGALALAVAVQHRSTAGSASVGSVQGRVAIWRNTLVMIGEHPLRGVGLAAHPLFYPAYHRRAVVDPLFSARQQLDFAHDDYLQLAAETGLVGIGILAVLAVSAVGLARQAHTRAQGGEAVLAAAVAASAAGLLTDAVFSFPAYRALPPWLLALDAAVLAVIARGAVPTRTLLIAVPARRRALAAAAILACLALVATQARWLRADHHVRAALGAQARGDLATATREASAALALDSARADAWFALGTAQLLSGRPAEAVPALQEAVGRAPFDITALGNLGFARKAAGDRGGAVEALRRAVRISPGEADIAYQLGQLLQDSGDGAGALEAFRLAAAARPGDPRAQLRRGLLAMRARQFPEAEEALRAALALEPRAANTHKALGVVLLNSGRRTDAAAQFEEALRLDPTMTDRAMMERVIADAGGPRG
jgi:tetratricopeptide (TPR) repeat protein